jgi:hypothetical protein
VRAIEYECVRSKRKSIGIQILSDGKVIVRAPKNVADEVISECVKKREKWILEKLEWIQEKLDHNPPTRYVEGEFFMFLGEKFPLLFKADDSHKQCRVYLEEGFLVYENGTRSVEAIQKHLEMWYRKAAQDLVEDRIRHYLKHFDVEPTYIKVKTQKKRWGSCTSKRQLRFNFNLIKAPIEVLDYIVIHEMSHMVHMNHSDKFWSLVGAIMPNYKIQVDWLKENGHIINKC